MKYQFIVTDEKTLTNDTVKVTVTLSGPANDTRANLESKVRNALQEFIPNSEWVYTGFTINRSSGFPTFFSSASARIAAAANADLEKAAQKASSDDVSLVISVDTAIPLHVVREGYDQMRLKILELVQKEVARLTAAGYLFKIQKVDFRPGSRTQASTAKADDGTIGYAEKITGAASVTLISNSND